MQWGTLFGPFREPSKAGGTGQERPKGGQKAIEMCFGTVLDHLGAILLHFEPKLKIVFCFVFRFGGHFGSFWAIFGPFWGLGQGGTGQGGQKGVKRP